MQPALKYIPKKTNKAASTRTKILNSAEEAFALKGFDGARTQIIANKAGINKAMIHYYFEDKRTLYHAVMDRLFFDLIQLTQDVLKKNLKGPVLVEGLFVAMFDYATRHKHFARLIAFEGRKEDRYLEGSIKNLFRPLLRRGEEFLGEQIRKKAIRKIDARHFLISTFLMTVSYFYDDKFISILFGEDATSKKVLEERKKALLDFLYSILGL